jgi:hypothetical protein
MHLFSISLQKNNVLTENFEISLFKMMHKMINKEMFKWKGIYKYVSSCSLNDKINKLRN